MTGKFRILLVILFSAFTGTGLIMLQANPNASQTAICNINLNNKQYNKALIDSAIRLVKTGDVVLRTGVGAESYMMARMSQRDKSFSHCGIVLIENGYPFVYHCLGGEENPDARLRRDSLCRFFSPYFNCLAGVVRYDFDTSIPQKIRQLVKGIYRSRPKFDLKFDLKTDDKLYCSEFVYKAIDSAVANWQFIKPTNAMGLTYIAIDDLYLNGHARLLLKLKFR